MDVRKPKIQPGQPLPLADKVYRYGINTMVEKEDRFTPSPYFFDLSNTDKITGYSLSVDWDKKTTPEEGIIRIGCSYKSKPALEFKNYKNRVIYALEIEFIDSLDWIRKIEYSPTIHKKGIFGHPNNKAHSLVFYDQAEYAQNRAALLTELRNHAKDKKVEFDMTIVEKAVEKYRKNKE